MTSTGYHSCIRRREEETCLCCS